MHRDALANYKQKEKICKKIKHVLPENQDKDTSTHWAFATIDIKKTKQKNNNNNKSTHKREQLWDGRRGNIHSSITSKHMMCRQPPADHQM